MTCAPSRPGTRRTSCPGSGSSPASSHASGTTSTIYPSRWAFADYLALDAAGGHLSLYSVNSGPIHPVVLGFLRHPSSGRCSGSLVLHRPPVSDVDHGSARNGRALSSAFESARTAEQSILAYRRDNGIDAYPSVQTKLGARLNTLARAPLIKADLVKLKPFRDWGADLPRLPSPALLHPVAFQPGGHDENDPDFLPPDPRWGTNADFTSVVEAAHSSGQLVMPYLNVSWWDDDSPTMQISPVAAPAGGHRRPRRGRQAGRRRLRLEVRAWSSRPSSSSCAAGWRG